VLSEIPEGAFEEDRYDRESRAEMPAIRAGGQRLPSEVFDTTDYRAHIYAAQADGRRW
jgi:hypothetical protein